MSSSLTFCIVQGGEVSSPYVSLEKLLDNDANDDEAKVRAIFEFSCRVIR